VKGAAGWGIALVRVVTGVIYVMHGYLGLMVLGPATMAGYVKNLGFPATLAPALAWYGLAAHLLGGALLVLGLWTRWAALANVPVIAAALFLLHWRQGFFMGPGGGYEYTLLLFAVTVGLVLTGGGTAELTRGRR
jgi:putative oxidoreductase